MPDFWQFPTVSMGLGPLMAIYQARFMSYLRGPRPRRHRRDRKVWAFLGDGEMDEPDRWARSRSPRREQLDNLIFVVNCNLQRLDGPVRGNGKIIQELEALFRGAGWNVIKVLWGTRLGRAARRATRTGLLRQAHGRVRRRRVPDVQVAATARTCASTSSASTRNCSSWSSDLTRRRDLGRCSRGGHDPVKVYAAYEAAVDTRASRR